MKVAGSRGRLTGMAAPAFAAALILALVGAPAAAAPAPITDTIRVALGTYYREDIFPPSDGSPFEVSASTINGSGPFDLYIIRTLEFARKTYPDGDFAPLVTWENVTVVTSSFAIPSRLESYSLIIDNLNNSRPGNAQARGLVQINLTRTPPLQANPEAQAALATGTTICAAGLAVAAVVLAIHLKRRKRPDTDEDIAARAPRIEIPVEIPKPPPGSWARAETLDRETQETKE
jgi:hypothetical protein